MRVRFRGVRGSVPWAMPEAAACGCNTACLEIADEATGAVLLLDAGSGIVGADPDARDIPLLLTHYHWDHVLGLPFFAPVFRPDRRVTLCTPRLDAFDPAWFDTLFSAPFFPISCEQLPARPEQRVIEPGTFAVGGFQVTAAALNHPGGAFAYRIEGRTGHFVYATDHEFGDPACDGPLAALAEGASAIVLDAHFTPEERPQFRGWGHSDWRQCAEFAAARRAGALYLFHHRPGRTDAELEAIEHAARRVFTGTHVAREGQCFTV